MKISEFENYTWQYADGLKKSMPYKNGSHIRKAR